MTIPNQTSLQRAVNAWTAFANEYWEKRKQVLQGLPWGVVSVEALEHLRVEAGHEWAIRLEKLHVDIDDWRGALSPNQAEWIDDILGLNPDIGLEIDEEGRDSDDEDEDDRISVDTEVPNARSTASFPSFQCLSPLLEPPRNAHTMTSWQYNDYRLSQRNAMNRIFFKMNEYSHELINGTLPIARRISQLEAQFAWLVNTEVTLQSEALQKKANKASQTLPKAGVARKKPAPQPPSIPARTVPATGPSRQEFVFWVPPTTDATTERGNKPPAIPATTPALAKPPPPPAMTTASEQAKRPVTPSPMPTPASRVHRPQVDGSQVLTPAWRGLMSEIHPPPSSTASSPPQRDDKPLTPPPPYPMSVEPLVKSATPSLQLEMADPYSPASYRSQELEPQRNNKRRAPMTKQPRGGSSFSTGAVRGPPPPLQRGSRIPPRRVRFGSDVQGGLSDSTGSRRSSNVPIEYDASPVSTLRRESSRASSVTLVGSVRSDDASETSSVRSARWMPGGPW